MVIRSHDPISPCREHRPLPVSHLSLTDRAPAGGPTAGHGAGHDRAGQGETHLAELSHDPAPFGVDIGRDVGWHHRSGCGCLVRLLAAYTLQVRWATTSTSRTGCGCGCATGAPHESPALSYSVAGRTKILTLAAEEVPAVAAAVTRYRETVTALEVEARAELDALVARVHTRRARRRARSSTWRLASCW